MRPLTMMIVLGALLLLATHPLGAQGRRGADAPAEYDAALGSLAAGDTAAAIEQLRRATRAAPRFGPAFLRLGALLSARAGERESNYRERVEAERALSTALRLLPDDPEPILEWGLLLRRQQVRGDAVRALERAWRAAEQKASGLPPDQRGRLHYELALIYETWWEDWQNLVSIPPAATPVSCGAIDGPASHKDASVACPAAWAEQLPVLVPLSEMRSDEWQRMLAHFRLALEANPAHVDAAVRLLGHLADADEWEEYHRVAARLAAIVPEDPRAHLFLGLALHERGRSRAADSVFAHAITLLPPDERRVFEDVSLLLPERARERYASLDASAREDANRLFFASTNPLFLSGVDQRRLEHYARLAWAELKFAPPTSANRGWDTDRGKIWVRYGRPWRWYQCCVRPLNPTSEYSSEDAVRQVYWSYGENGPVFVFDRRITYRAARITDVAGQLDEQMRRTAPELYRPRTLPVVVGFPHQVVRFRGREPNATRLEVYALPPLDTLGVEPGNEIEAGFFLFDPAYHPLWGEPGRARVRDTVLGLTYRLDLLPAEYIYSLEARRADADSVPRPAARERRALRIQPHADGVALSDILLAVLVDDQGRPAERRSDLRIAPLRSMDLPEGEPLALYFEVYGLAADAEGYGQYHASLAVEDSTRRNIVQRVTRGVQQLMRGGEPGATLRWERTARVHDGVAIDYLRIDPEGLTTGEYVIRVRVEDAATGRAATTVRRFRIVERIDDDEGEG